VIETDDTRLGKEGALYYKPWYPRRVALLTH